MHRAQTMPRIRWLTTSLEFVLVIIVGLIFSLTHRKDELVTEWGIFIRKRIR